MRARVIATCLILAIVQIFASTAFAGDVSAPTGIAVTIYNGNLALIKEQRDFDLDNGVQTLTLSEVSGQLNPSSVHLAFDGGGVFELLEQNYDYDLVSQDKLLEKFIGRQVMLVEDKTGQTKTVTLLSTSGGYIVKDNEGQILLNPPGRMVLPPGAADELLLKPTLSWQLWSDQRGARAGEISYLSGGLDWNADYVVMLNADDTQGGIEGWVTISNYSGTTYRDAKLKLVAGDVNRVHDQEVMRKSNAIPPPAPAAMPAGFAEEAFFEYHLYDLQRPTTLRNNQMKQIGLLTAVDVPFTKIYAFDGMNGGDMRVYVEFKNEEEAGMGMPLPKGTVRVFKQDSKGDAQFVGEDRIDHTPKDEKVKLYLGNAFDVVGECIQTDYRDLRKGYEASYKVTLKNHKDAGDVMVTVGVNVGGDWQVLASNFDYVEKSQSQIEFNVPVKADGETVLTYSYRVTWK